MAKKKSKDELDLDNVELDENGQPVEKGNKLTSALIAIAVIAIWLVIFGLLIKMDVGGVGSMLRPYLKNVPVISKILPEASDEEIAEENGYQFKNLSEAIDRIKELETELAGYQANGNSNSQQVQDMQAEIDRLKTFEDNQEYYDQLKDQFDNEVVYTDNAPDIEEYKKWYESIDPDNAERLYKEVVEKIEFSQRIKDWAETYAKMDAKNAAKILEEMTGDTDLVSKILLCMTSKQRAAVMAEMDTIYAAKLTKIMYP